MAYDSQRTQALPWQIAQSQAPNQPRTAARRLVADCNAVSVKRPNYFFAMARRTAYSFMASINEIARMCRRF